MTTPIPDEPQAKLQSPHQQAFRPLDDALDFRETPLPSDLTVQDALTRWKDSRTSRYEPLLAAGELHGVMPRPPKRQGV